MESEKSSIEARQQLAARFGLNSRALFPYVEKEEARPHQKTRNLFGGNAFGFAAILLIVASPIHLGDGIDVGLIAVCGVLINVGFIYENWRRLKRSWELEKAFDEAAKSDRLDLDAWARFEPTADDVERARGLASHVN